MGHLVQMGYDDWHTQFQPVQNNVDPNETSYDNTLFETYGKDLDFVRKQDPDAVWTLVDSEDDDSLMIIEGFHRVNRIGYFVTKVARTGSEAYEITD